MSVGLFFSLLYELSPVTGPQVEKHCSSDTKLRIFIEIGMMTNYQRKQWMKKADKLFHCCISVLFLVAVKYRVGTGCWFIIKGQPGLEEILLVKYLVKYSKR